MDIKTQEMLDAIRKQTPLSIAESIVSVQPIDSNFFQKLLESSKDEEQLRADGYIPIDPLTKLMWVKKNEDNEDDAN